jgi:hypothetical protein
LTVNTAIDGAGQYLRSDTDEKKAPNGCRNFE